MLPYIALTVAQGEVVITIRPTDSGKFTLCRAIYRLKPIDSGDGVTVWAEPSSRKCRAGRPVEIGYEASACDDA